MNCCCAFLYLEHYTAVGDAFSVCDTWRLQKGTNKNWVAVSVMQRLDNETIRNKWKPLFCNVEKRAVGLQLVHWIIGDSYSWVIGFAICSTKCRLEWRVHIFFCLLEYFITCIATFCWFISKIPTCSSVVSAFIFFCNYRCDFIT